MKITVVGAGVMGPGIAQVFMLGGHKVLLHDVAQEILDKGVKRVASSLDTMNEAGVLKQSPAEYMSLLTTTTSKTEAYDGAKLVIEAIPEKLDLKEKLYREMDSILPPDAIISSNTSSLPLPNIFPDFRPGRFIVSHFFNPPPLIPLVELVGNKQTNPECLKWLKELLIQCGKSPIVLKDFVKGFFANRVQGAAGRETMYLVNPGSTVNRQKSASEKTGI